MRRVALAVIAALGLGSFGFIIGGTIASTLLVRTVDGFAAPAVVALGAAGGALAGFVAALIAAARMRPDSAPTLALGSALAGIAAWPAFWALEAARMSAGQTYETQPLNASGRPFPPALPPRGTRDSLIGLVEAAESMLPHFETRETGYEVKAIAVYGRSGAYYLAGMADSTRGWLHSADVGAFRPVDSLVVNRLNYLTPSWDLHIRDQPSQQAERTAVGVERAREIPAKVLETVMRPDGAWLRVEVLDKSPCEGTPTVVATGWIPVWGQDARPTAWFYSRGC
jgi:hypothetical protein